MDSFWLLLVGKLDKFVDKSAPPVSPHIGLIILYDESSGS
jgi:hypothetical protein